MIDDDNTLSQPLARHLLQAQGYRVEAAASSADALAKTIAGRPDLVQLDLGMPPLSRIRFVRCLRRNDGFESIPVVAKSASAADDDQAACIAAGCDGFIAKPFVTPDLLDAVTRALARQPAELNQPIIFAPAGRPFDSRSLPRRVTL